MPCEIVKTAEADFVESATEVAVSVTVEGVGTLGGAAKVTLVAVIAERVPHDAPLQPVPVRAHVTPCPLGSLVTEAVNDWDKFTETVREEGEMDTEIGFGIAMAILAVANLVVSLMEVAVMLTFGGLGGTLGAV